MEVIALLIGVIIGAVGAVWHLSRVQGDVVGEVLNRLITKGFITKRSE